MNSLKIVFLFSSVGAVACHGKISDAESRCINKAEILSNRIGEDEAYRDFKNRKRKYIFINGVGQELPGLENEDIKYRENIYLSGEFFEIPGTTDDRGEPLGCHEYQISAKKFARSYNIKMRMLLLGSGSSDN